MNSCTDTETVMISEVFNHVAKLTGNPGSYWSDLGSRKAGLQRDGE